ncbi:MAG: MBL fold metallo-hydrolase [Lachnospiraceae bacterium]|nr:MBL fold metallo-hydrolase [Lachnospiraceae bacterium]
MKVTYIHHSSFSVEFSRAVFLFDYFEGELPVIPKEKELVVFASHKHQDHFNRSIFELEKEYPTVRFLLSKDIRMSENYRRRMGISDEAAARITYMGKNQAIDFMVGGQSLKVETLTSTDEGVAFLLDYEGRSLYHAGDLNWWTWIGETEMEYKDMTRRFQSEMEKVRGRHFDAAFVPLDPRQGERYFWGFDYFMRVTDTDVAFPMHFWGDFSIIDRLISNEISEPYRKKVRKILEKGEVTEI